MKKLCLLLCLILVGCASKPTTPEGTMHAFFSGFKSFNFEEMNSYLNEPIPQETQDDFNSFLDYTHTTKTMKQVMSILKEMKVEWVETDHQDTQVSYQVTVTYYSCIELKENYLEYFIQAFDDHANPELYDQKLADAYYEAYMRSSPVLKKTFDVTCIQVGNTWQLIDGNQLFLDLTKPIRTQINALYY